MYQIAWNSKRIVSSVHSIGLFKHFPRGYETSPDLLDFPSTSITFLRAVRWYTISQIFKIKISTNKVPRSMYNNTSQKPNNLLLALDAACPISLWKTEKP